MQVTAPFRIGTLLCQVLYKTHCLLFVDKGPWACSHRSEWECCQFQGGLDQVQLALQYTEYRTNEIPSLSGQTLQSEVRRRWINSTVVTWSCAVIQKGADEEEEKVESRDVG